MMPIQYQVRPRRVALILGGIAVFLALQSIVGEYYTTLVLDAERYPLLYLLIDLTSVNAEATIPTWFSTLILFISACLLAIIAQAKWHYKDRFVWYWVGLAITFLYLSADEGAVIHEIIVEPLQSALNPTGYMAFAWYIVAVPLVLLFVLIYIRFLLKLPALIRNLMIISGAIYISGVLIIEAISANQWYLAGGITFNYLAIATLEELFEMLGIVLFIYTLLLYMRMMAYQIVVNTADTPATVISTNTTASHPSTIKQRSPYIYFLLLMVGVLIGFNGIILYQSANSTTKVDDVPFYQHIVDQYTVDDVVILHIDGAFNRDNDGALKGVSALLETYDEVIVVTLPDINRSLVFAGASLPFDQYALGELLRINGLSQFIIFDMLTAQLIVGSSS